jgi:release factor glutamine methyltransferase
MLQGKQYWNSWVEKQFKIVPLELYPGLNGRTFDHFLRQLFFLEHIKDFDSFLVPYECSLFFTQKIIQHLKDGLPLAYILGFRHFAYSRYFVTKDTLIPRFESEKFIEMITPWFKEHLGDHSLLRIIDVGTGPGTLLLSLAQQWSKMSSLPFYGYGIDISKEALDVAKRNYFMTQFQYASKVQLEWIYSDRLANWKNGSVDCIISNPPYIKRGEHRKSVHDQVDSFCPHLALYLDDHIYEDWFTLFFAQCEKTLRKNGLFVMEGHENECANLAKLLSTFQFKNITVMNDDNNRPRFVQGIKK